MHVKLLIKKKKGVFDPEAKVVETTLKHLGFSITNPKFGKILSFEIDAKNIESAEKKVRKMCTDFLVNPVLEDYSFEIIE